MTARGQRVVVLGGAGAQAAECVRYLMHAEECSIMLADRTVGGAHQLASELDPDGERITVVEHELTTIEATAAVLSGADVVANFIGPFHRWGAIVAAAAIDAGTHYVDVCDDDIATRAMLAMSESAADAGVSVITGLGSGPGVTNILAGLCAGSLDTVCAVEFGWFASGDPRTAGPAAFEHLLWGFTTPFTARIDGRDVTIKPFDDDHSAMAEFPEPFGSIRLWAFPHPEAVTFAHFVPGLETSINRGCAYPLEVMHVLRAWHLLGYSSETSARVAGVDVPAATFAVQHFLTHGLGLGVIPTLPHPDASGMSIRVAGTRGGRPTEYRITAASGRTMATETGVPAGVGVAMLLAGDVAVSGVLAPECLDPAVFFDRFGRRPRSGGEASGLKIVVDDGDVAVVRMSELLARYRPLAAW